MDKIALLVVGLLVLFGIRRVLTRFRTKVASFEWFGLRTVEDDE